MPAVRQGVGERKCTENYNKRHDNNYLVKLAKIYSFSLLPVLTNTGEIQIIINVFLKLQSAFS